MQIDEKMRSDKILQRLNAELNKFSKIKKQKNRLKLMK